MDRAKVAVADVVLAVVQEMGAVRLQALA